MAMGATNLKPARRRWRRWIALLAMLGAGAWFARYAWLRMTLRPTPRSDYWNEQIARLDPPGPDALSEADMRQVLASRPWETDGTISQTNRNEILQVLQGGA